MSIQKIFADRDYVDQKISAIPTPDVSGQIGTHNTATDAHNDIRNLIDGLTTRLNTLANSDDVTLDQMSEIVAYIKSNKSLIENITTNKVNVSDIINNLTTNVENKPLSGAQGVVLKTLIDSLDSNKLNASSLTSAINTALAQAKASGEFDGEDGYTPVKGTDFWTQTDKAEIVQETTKNFPILAEEPEETIYMLESSDIDPTLFIAGKAADAKAVGSKFDLIFEEITKINRDGIIEEVIAALGTPVFGRIDENNNIILSGELIKATYTVKYENADGTLIKIGTIRFSYTNLADQTSADWLTNKRINSSNTLVDADGVDMTNFIPVSGASAIHVKGLDILSELSGGQNYGRVYWYDADKNYIAYCQPSTKTEFFPSADYDNTITVIDWTQCVDYWAGNKNTFYIRLGGIPTAENIIITVDEPITGNENEDAPAYINQLTLALGSDGNVYNGVGYRDNYRLTPSGTEIADDSYIASADGMFVTGFIPYTYTQAYACAPFYIKGVNLESITDTVRSMLFNDITDTTSNFYPKQVKWTTTDDTGVDIEKLGDLYYKITPRANFYAQTNQSAENINYIRFSLPGTGNGVIITIDQNIV